jgi:hypothetical protein
MKVLILPLLFIFTFNAFANDVTRFEGDYELLKGDKDCPARVYGDYINTIGVMHLKDYHLSQYAPSFLKFPKINEGTYSSVSAGVERFCAKTTLEGNTLAKFWAAGLSVFRPCFTVKKEKIGQISLRDNDQILETLKVDIRCTYQRL